MPGGDFTRATNSGGVAVTVNYIAKWDGGNWSALGSGINFNVYALAAAGINVYAGGAFTAATNSGGVAVPVSRIAKWNGSSWSALGAGMNNSVWALAVSGSDVYAGGDFTMATNTGGVTIAANLIAKWDGSSWSALGAGMNQRVSALAVMGSDIYAGGTFTVATNSGGVAVTVNRIAKWDGSSWSALEPGLESAVAAVAVVGSNVYAGGAFSSVGGVTALNIAKWNGSSWSAVGAGMNFLFRRWRYQGATCMPGGCSPRRARLRQSGSPNGTVASGARLERG